MQEGKKLFFVKWALLKWFRIIPPRETLHTLMNTISFGWFFSSGLPPLGSFLPRAFVLWGYPSSGGLPVRIGTYGQVFICVYLSVRTYACANAAVAHSGVALSFLGVRAQPSVMDVPPHTWQLPMLPFFFAPPFSQLEESPPRSLLPFFFSSSSASPFSHQVGVKTRQQNCSYKIVATQLLLLLSS